jgi:hypothetical protein
MATSGTNTFNLTVDEVIDEALSLAGGDLSSGEDLKKARRALNLLLIDMQNRGHPLAELENRTFTVASASASYTLSADVLDVLDVVITRSSVATPVERISLFEYHKIPTKTDKGRPSQYAVDRDRDNVTVHLYQTPENSTDVIDYWCVTAIEDAGAYSNDIDLNKRYLPAVTFGLAYYISMKRPEVDPAKRQELAQNYVTALDNAMMEDRERTSYKVSPFAYCK